MKKNCYFSFPSYVPVRVIKLFVEQLRDMGFWCLRYEYVLRVDHISPRQRFDIEHLVFLLGQLYMNR